MRSIIQRRSVKAAVKACMANLNISHKFAVDCETRWGAVYNLVVSFVTILPALYAYTRTNNALPGLTNSILLLIESLPVLKVFIAFWRDADKYEVELQGDRYPTAASSWPFALKMTEWRKTQVVPLAAVVPNVAACTMGRLYPELTTVLGTYDVQRMQRLIGNIALAVSASVYFGAMSEIFFKERLALDNYFPALLRHATILNPSTKALTFLAEAERDLHYRALDELAREHVDPAAMMEMRLPEALPPYPSHESELWRYLNLAGPVNELPSMQFWFSPTAGAAFPALRALFERFNSIPATSAPSERFFSSTGNTVRASLSSQRLTNLAITQRNAPIIAQLGLTDPTTMALDLPP